MQYVCVVVFQVIFLASILLMCVLPFCHRGKGKGFASRVLCAETPGKSNPDTSADAEVA